MKSDMRREIEFKNLHLNPSKIMKPMDIAYHPSIDMTSCVQQLQCISWRILVSWQHISRTNSTVMATQYIMLNDDGNKSANVSVAWI